MRTHRKVGGAGGGSGTSQAGRVTATRDVFVTDAGAVWAYQGHTAFLLFYRWLIGDDIDPVVAWMRSRGANVARVLGMVSWRNQKFGFPDQVFGPSTPGFWDRLPSFVDHLARAGMRVEFVVFASAQDILPDVGAQRVHLHRVIDTIGDRWNVLIEIANEPWQNGAVPVDLFPRRGARSCPMAYGDYTPTVTRAGDRWTATLPVLDYLTFHAPRMIGWARKAKDAQELRDGSGDGSEQGPAMDGLHVPVVGDEPMGAAEADRLAGRQRSNDPADFFWHHATAHLLGAGSTFHSDAGLQAQIPPAGGDQERCADAVALAWANIDPAYQRGDYVRSGLAALPVVWNERDFPDDQISRIYGRILGHRACCVAIHPTADWRATAAPGWRIVKQTGPQNSLIELERA